MLIVDEVGDIMTSSISKEFEVLIKRLAQKAHRGDIRLYRGVEIRLVMLLDIVAYRINLFTHNQRALHSH